MKAFIDFEKLLKGEYRRRRRYGPMANYDAKLGASVSTNDFADENLDIFGILSPISILCAIIISARGQKDFKEIEIVNFSMPIFPSQIELIEKLTLSYIILTSKSLLISLVEKVIFEKEIGPYLSMTTLHPNYKTPKEIQHLISVKVPKEPTVEEMYSILQSENQEAELIINEIKTVASASKGDISYC